jgi:hypothetical protein
MTALSDEDLSRRLRAILPWVGLLLVAVVSLPPLLLAQRPVELVEPFSSPVAAWASKALVILGLGAVVALPALVDRKEPGAWGLVLLFVVWAGLMVAVHWWLVDSLCLHWQQGLYEKILSHESVPPHQFRALPYGFTRTLEEITGDWDFSCAAYRWFFNFWFLWWSYRFARLFLRPGWSLLSLVPLLALYPVSVVNYYGQLTDPVSHALFALALIYTIEDRWLALAAALFVGVLAKETILLMAPVYWAAHYKEGWRALGKTVVLGLACVAAFLAARVPYGWWPSYEKINGTDELMIWANLDIGTTPYNPLVSLPLRYLHLTLLWVPFVPFLAWGWRRLDGRLKAMCLTLTPLLLLSNLCFGWIYESRNYMPMVPLLATASLCALPWARREPPDDTMAAQSG